jgi:hypothetical protein
MGVKPGLEHYETNVLWNRALREIPQPKGQEIIRGRRKLHNEELQQIVDYKGHTSKEGEKDGKRSVYGESNRDVKVYSAACHEGPER